MKNIFFPLLFIFLGIFFPSLVLAQEDLKGTFYFYWGYNRSDYTKSNIHFIGPNYDFTLDKVDAKDRQTPFNFKKYFNPTTLTIPQYNYRIGYYFKKKYEWSLGLDHMKYVMVNDQTVNITGDINVGNIKYDGSYNNVSIVLANDFLTYEHTNGLNYLVSELTRSDNLWTSTNDKFHFNTLVGVGLAMLIPKSNVMLFGNRNDQFHISGWGSNIKGGFQFVMFKRFFFRSELKGGFIHMPDVTTQGNKLPDKASQSFFFYQINYVWGFNFPLSRRLKAKGN